MCFLQHAVILFFRELVKLFCTENSHEKELTRFLNGLITLLHVSRVEYDHSLASLVHR